MNAYCDPATYGGVNVSIIKTNRVNGEDIAFKYTLHFGSLKITLTEEESKNIIKDLTQKIKDVHDPDSQLWQNMRESWIDNGDGTITLRQ